MIDCLNCTTNIFIMWLFKPCSVLGVRQAGREGEEGGVCPRWMWSHGRQADIWAPGGASALLWAAPLPSREAEGIWIGVPPGPCGALWGPFLQRPWRTERGESGAHLCVCLCSWGAIWLLDFCICLDVFYERFSGNRNIISLNIYPRLFYWSLT